MQSDRKNYYEVLEIPVNATPDQIEKAYNSALVAYSEDSVAIYSLMSSDDCKDLRNQIEEAYSILGLPAKRKEYDRARGLNQKFYQDLDQQEIENNAKNKLPSFDFNEGTQNLDPNEYLTTYRNPPAQGVNSIKKNSEIDVLEAKKKFALQHEVHQDMEQKIQNCTDYSGSFLKEIREYKNVSLEKMSEMSRIMKTYLTYIENEEFSKLPATAYIRGFVFQYAKHLKLNPDLVSNSYIQRVKQIRGEPITNKVI